MNIASLKEARAAKTDAIRAIIAKATTEKRDLSEQERRRKGYWRRERNRDPTFSSR